MRQTHIHSDKIGLPLSLLEFRDYVDIRTLQETL